MQFVTGTPARTVLTDPAFVVPPVPGGARGVAWLRASVARFSSGETHRRRRALAVALLDSVPPESLGTGGHPVAILARALGLDAPVHLVDDVAQAYQPGTGDEAVADAAVERLVTLLGGRYDEATAARIGVLVQACRATADLADRTRNAPVDEVLRENPPVRATKRQAVVPVELSGTTIDAGEIVQVDLADSPFGAGAHACPGRAHALALVSVDRTLRAPVRPSNDTVHPPI